MWDGMGGMGMGTWGVLMSIFWLLFLALIVVGIVLVVRATSAGSGGGVPPAHSGSGAYPAYPAGSRAQEILDERFARGEIDEEEYRRRKDVLREAGRA